MSVSPSPARERRNSGDYPARLHRAAWRRVVQEAASFLAMVATCLPWKRAGRCGDATDEPTECRNILLRVEGAPGFAAEDRLPVSLQRHDVEHRVHVLGGKWQLVVMHPAQELHLLVRRNGQRTLKPELSHSTRQIVIALNHFGNDLLIALNTDKPRQILEIPNAGTGKGTPQGLVLIP